MGNKTKHGLGGMCLICNQIILNFRRLRNNSFGSSSRQGSMGAKGLVPLNKPLVSSSLLFLFSSSFPSAYFTVFFLPPLLHYFFLSASFSFPFAAPFSPIISAQTSPVSLTLEKGQDQYAELSSPESRALNSATVSQSNSLAFLWS